MANDLFLSVVLGAAVQGSFSAVLGGAKRTLEGLGATTDKLKQKHVQMGAAMQRAVGTLSGGTMAAINRDYENVWFRPILFRSVAGLYSRRKV